MYTDTFDEPTYKGLSYLFSSRTKSISILYAGAAPENVERRCWGGARSMTGRDGQLIVNMTKTGCYYYYFYMNNKITIIGAFQMCMRNVGLSRLWGRTHNDFYYLFFPVERVYTPVIFGYAFCRIMQSPWMERVTTMNQLTDIRNKSAKMTHWIY